VFAATPQPSDDGPTPAVVRDGERTPPSRMTECRAPSYVVGGARCADAEVVKNTAAMRRPASRPAQTSRGSPPSLPGRGRQASS